MVLFHSTSTTPLEREFRNSRTAPTAIGPTTLRILNTHDGLLPFTSISMGNKGYPTVFLSSCQRSGSQRLGFSSIHFFCWKNTQVSETKEFRQPYFRLSHNRNSLSNTSAVIKCYRGPGIPRWADVNSSMSPRNKLFSTY